MIKGFIIQKAIIALSSAGLVALAWLNSPMGDLFYFMFKRPADRVKLACVFFSYLCIALFLYGEKLKNHKIIMSCIMAMLLGVLTSIATSISLEIYFLYTNPKRLELFCRMPFQFIELYGLVALVQLPYLIGVFAFLIFRILWKWQEKWRNPL